MLTVTSHASESVINKAFTLLSEYYSGKKNYQIVKPHHYIKVNVSLRWRLLSKDGGKRWVLMTHERYNKQFRI
ncbi:hypothetical protein CG542_19215 [Salmonella enterica]|jgi:hypothetical protein|uniref:ParE family toxin-like protein n=1 Tax=Citrobacter freundii complex TaxID=1344959 RepID=UPI000FB901D0|nr:hypothetical protein [Salmonella enterica]EBI0350924.1 hypothetical protein [Salmonella enterica subsp. arizonae serovar 48:z4,z23,z32:-]EBM5795690.1 hypothetical protein [Salmonella enterica]EBS9963509.1 hypothetical protein [Salmonella enterica]EDZ6958172.1 hypothetical protein [Salmonella enterica]